jgi:hypothetical protein
MAKGDVMVATIGFWAMVISAVMLVAWLVLGQLVKKFGREKLVYGYHNGVRVLTRRDDYTKAKHDSQMKKPGGFVAVPNSIVFFDNDSRTWADKSLMLGDMNLFNRLTGWEVDIVDDLFVPFVSSRLMSLDDQGKFFRRLTPQEAEEYLHGDRPSFLSLQWQKLAKWYRHLSWPSDITTTLGCVTVAAFLVWGAAWLSKSDQERKWEFTTNTSAADPSVITYSEKFPIAANDEFGGRLFEFTITKEPIYLGGGLVSVEGTYSDDGSETAVRASAALNLKKDNVVTVRIGQVMNQKHKYIFEAWVITREEAQALLASGKFRLVGKK